MIALGYPGDISADTNTKMIYFVLSMIPFLYILWILFGELSKSIAGQSGAVTALVSKLRTVLLLTWCVYPVSYLMPVLGFDGANAFVGRQIGYTIADVTAKCLFGIMIYQIAKTKSAEDSKDYAWDESH
jgi:bacteriorhodopsin